MHLNAPIAGIVPECDNSGYFLVGKDNSVFAYGSAVFRGGLVGHHLAAPIVALIATSTYRGYWLVDANGRTFPFGDAH